MRSSAFLLFGLLCWQAAAAAQTVDNGPEQDHQQRNVTGKTDAAGPAASATESTSDAPDTVGPAKPKKSAQRSGKTSNDRLFFALPNFLTVENSGDVAALTAGEKFKTTARGAFDPAQFGFVAIEAGISQAFGHDADYGGGAKGYAQRFGVRFADGAVENFFSRAIFPSVLHEDPRYFQLGQGGFFHRAFYAVSRIFVTRTDSGSETFNFSEILGSATAAGISSYTYHPHDAHNLSSALNVWGTQVGYDALSNSLKEFWPDLRRKLSKHNAGAAAPSQQH